MILLTDIKQTEYDPYFQTYINLTGGDLVERLDKDIMGISEDLSKIPEDKYDYAYAEGKWTIAELIQHCVDTERVLQYRAFCIARGEQAMLNGFDENAYVDIIPEESIHFGRLMGEMHALRASTITMFANLPPKAAERIGNANGSALSSRAAGFIILGHWQHHMNILKTRYLNSEE